MKWSWLLWAFTSLLALGLADNARGPVFPDLIQTFGLTDTAASFFFVTTSISGLLSTFTAGWWTRRFGAKTSAIALSLIFSVGLAGLSFATSYPAVLLWMAVIGVGLSGCGVMQNLLTILSAPAHRQRGALGLLHCMYGVGSWLAPLTVAQIFVLSPGAGWNTPFRYLAAGPFLLAVWAFFLRPVTSGENLERRHKEATAAKSLSRKAFWELVPLALVSTLYVASEILISSRLVLYLRRDLAWSEMSANYALSLFFALMFIGRVSLILLPARWPAKAMLLILATLTVASLVVGFLISPWGIPCSGLFMAMFFPILMAWVGERFALYRETVTGIILGTNACGLILMHFAIGRLADQFGLGVALWASPLALALAALLLLRESSDQVSLPR